LTDGVRPADERFAASLQEEIDQLSKLVDDLQTLALSDAGALNIQKETMDLASVAEHSVELYRDRLAGRGISVELRMDEPVTVSADPNRLRQLLQNLLENSCRYVEENGQVVLTLLQSPGSVELVLEDSGPGLSHGQITRLFERFYRAEGSRTRSSGGTGLGLSICKNIAEAHGGSIRAVASDMGGLKIQVDLPV
ncbi:ATP-binding protein, partial [Pseudomonadota bacterium]